MNFIKYKNNQRKKAVFDFFYKIYNINSVLHKINMNKKILENIISKIIEFLL